MTRPAPNFTRNYLWVIAAITFILGISLVLMPGWIVELFFASPQIDGTFFARLVGSTLVGYATLNALAARDGSHDTCSITVWSNLVTLLIASIISLRFRQAFDGQAWLIVGQHLVFASGFTYCAWELRRTAKD
jgi:hypothetical protein